MTLLILLFLTNDTERHFYKRSTKFLFINYFYMNFQIKIFMRNNWFI